jgi:hypothetical protein
MGVVNTTYTFTSTDTITSAKMNNIIDETTFTSDAIQGTTLQVVSPGKLAVSASGITSNELASNSVVTAKIADSNVTTAKIADANVTQAKLGTNVAGNGPAFAATGSSTKQAITSTVTTKVQLPNELFDTSNAFDSSTNYRFQPTVAGYYQINAVVRPTGNAGTMTLCFAELFKNGIAHVRGNEFTYTSNFDIQQVSVSGLVYLNGSSDYLELFARVDGTNVGFANSPSPAGSRAGCCWMDCFLARSA